MVNSPAWENYPYQNPGISKVNEIKEMGEANKPCYQQ